jgi:MoaA/NifB/PqqE/SkfB family radical SAM enzyme
MIDINLQGKAARINELKDNIISSINKRVSESVVATSAREKNLLFNDFEYAMGKIHLESTPEGVGIGAHYSCNAECVFCLGGKPKLFSLQRYKDFFEPKLGDALSKARYANFCGFGELLLMPDIEKFLEYVNEGIPLVNKIYTTNGTPLLNNKVLNLLTESKSVVEISLHASNGYLHKLLTKMNTFEHIVSGIRQLVSMRKHIGRPAIVLIFLVNTINIENLPDFIELAAVLGVDQVICNYMTIFHSKHLKLSCYFKQEITNASFEKAEELSHKLKIPLKLPPRFGLSSQTDKKHICSDPWKYFYVENETSVLPCCYAGDNFGYLEKVDFQTIWNGPDYKDLRSCLVKGLAHRWCKYCYKYRSKNVNDIRSHINFRPGSLEKILKGYKL